MKDFLKMTLAAIVGFAVVNIISFLFISMLLGAIASFGKTQPVMPASAILKIDLSKTRIGEQTQEENPLVSLQGGYSSVTGILDATRAIRHAAEDPSVKFIYMKPDLATGGMAQIEELRDAISDFRASGKAVVSYLENPTNAGYYLASASDKIYMTSHLGGMNLLSGISSQMFFLKDILDKLGVNVQLIRHGKFKSAGEMYTRSESSDENMAQSQELIDAIWSSWTDEIASSRNITAEGFNALLDELKLVSPEDFKENGLVDELLSQEQLKQKLTEYFGAENPEEVSAISLEDYITLSVTPNLKAKDKIAVIYAHGNIMEGGDDTQVDGDRFSQIIADIRKNDKIKSVVLRVNSPGGSVLASEKIRNELMLLSETKPVIASYGDYAASGGYWISVGSNQIFTNNSTITGSIGVFSMIPDFSKTLNDIAHVNITTVGSNKHSDIYSGFRALSSSEKNYMQASIEDIYERFTTIVSEGRQVSREYVDSVGQGRVWAGSDAIELKLADRKGTIMDAVEYAAVCGSENNDGDLNKWDIVEYPKPLTTIELLLQSIGAGSSVSVFDNTPLEGVANAFENWKASESGKIYARLPYEIVIQ